MSAVVLSKWEERHGGGNYLLTQLWVFSGYPNFRIHMAWHVTHLIGTPINPIFLLFIVPILLSMAISTFLAM